MRRVLEAARQVHCQRASRPVSAHGERGFETSCVMTPPWGKLNSCYGAPKMVLELRKAGIRTSKERGVGPMSEHGVAGTRGIGLRKPGKPEDEPETGGAEDPVKRDFEADDPDRARFADTTYVEACRGWLHVAIFIGVWSRMVVGRAMGPRIDAALANDALRTAITRRRPSSGLVHHDDHGPRYRPLPLGKTMREHGIRPSMGSVACPWDDAPAESFMGMLKRERVHREAFETRGRAQLEIFECIETFYNRLRIHPSSGFMSPMGFEERMAKEENVESGTVAA